MTRIQQHARTVALVAFALIILVLSLASCESREAKQARAIRAHQATELAQAARDSTRAARLDSVAARHYQQGRRAADSATYYHARAHENPVSIPAADTARLRRFFANLFGR